MAEYRLSDLEDQEFEKLCNDLTERLTGQRVERFTPGRDSGIDGRIFSNPDKTLIVQSKHYEKSGWNKLLTAVTKEASKIKELNPDSYMLFTSVGLTPARKSKLKRLLSPYLHSEKDIFGKDDILSLLDKHKDIVQTHYKLWAVSGSMMRTIFLEGFNIATNAWLDELCSKASGYAITSLHEKALDTLKQKRILLITGTPGIGKTTLAKQLLLASVSEGYAPFLISDDVKEALPHLEEGKKQIFFFDDFLGSNFLEALAPHMDSKIREFINIIGSGDRRFILTSRSHILDQGYEASDTLKHSGLKRCEFLLDIQALPDGDKAAILSRMLLQSPRLDALQPFQDIHFFRRTLLHHNFTPRLIETILNDLADAPADSLEATRERIVSALKDPTEIWRRAFNCQEDDASRILTTLVTLNGHDIEEQELEEIWDSYLNAYPLSQTSPRRITFQSVTTTLCRSFLCRKVRRENNGVRIEFSPANPSIRDFICTELTEDEWFKALRILNSNDSLLMLARMCRHSRMRQRVADRLLDVPLHTIETWSYVYIAQLGVLAGEECFRKVFNARFASTFVEIVREYEFQLYYPELVIDFFRRLERHFGPAGQNERRAFCLVLAKSAYDMDQIDSVAELAQEWNVCDAAVQKALKANAEECLHNAIFEILNDELDSYAFWIEPDEDESEGWYKLQDERQLVDDVLQRVNRILPLLTESDVKSQLHAMSDTELFGHREARAALHKFDQQLREITEVHREFVELFQERWEQEQDSSQGQEDYENTGSQG